MPATWKASALSTWRGTMRSLTKTSLRAPARLTGSVHTCVRCERRSGIRRALLPRFSLPSDTSSNRPWRPSPIWASAGLKGRLDVGRFAVEPRGKIRRRIAARREFPLRRAREHEQPGARVAIVKRAAASRSSRAFSCPSCPALRDTSTLTMTSRASHALENFRIHAGKRESGQRAGAQQRAARAASLSLAGEDRFHGEQQKHEPKQERPEGETRFGGAFRQHRRRSLGRSALPARRYRIRSSSNRLTAKRPSRPALLYV